MLDAKIEARVSGIVLTSPAVGVQPTYPIFGVSKPEKPQEFEQFSQTFCGFCLEN